MRRFNPVGSGSKTLKDAINEAIGDWVANVEDTHYLLGSVVGLETKRQVLEAEGRLPDALLLWCVFLAMSH